MFWLSALLIVSPFFIGWILSALLGVSRQQTLLLALVSFFAAWPIGGLTHDLPNLWRWLLALACGGGIWLAQTRIQKNLVGKPLRQLLPSVLARFLLLPSLCGLLLPDGLNLLNKLPAFQVP